MDGLISLTAQESRDIQKLFLQPVAFQSIANSTLTLHCWFVEGLVIWLALRRRSTNDAHW